MCTFNKKKPNDQTGGFIALISILILSAVLLTSTISLAQFGIANRFFILNLEQKNASKKLAEACVQIARIKIYNDPAYTVSAPLSIGIAGSTCRIYTVAANGTVTEIRTTAHNGAAVSNLCATVNNTTGDFVSFKEMPNITDTCP